MKETVETQNRSTLAHYRLLHPPPLLLCCRRCGFPQPSDQRQTCMRRVGHEEYHSNLTTKHVSAPAQCHTRHLQHPLTPPRAAGLNRVRTRVRSLQQAPSRQAARCSAAEAPAAGSPGPAGSPQAARTHVRAAVSDLDCSLPAPRRPSGSGSAGAMSRVGGALREQRGGGCARLGERCASWAACQSCAQLTCTAVTPVHACRPLCTSGLERSGVEPVGTPDRSSPEVHSGWQACTARRGRSILLGTDLTVDFYMILIRCGPPAARWPRRALRLHVRLRRRC